ncbi:MAG: glycosyltransferase [Clostridiaceae bacterium]
MVPKVIHCFWFGGRELPESDKKNMETWRRFCPDYEIKLWDESTYPIPNVPYVQQAFKMKKWGHVSDYARLDVLYKYGGIYLDTDVEIVRSFDSLLELDGFIGFEDGVNVNTGQGVGAEAGNTIIKGMMDDYLERQFIKVDGTCDLTPCPQINTKYLIELGLIQNDTLQTINDMVIFPTDYFCPKHILTGKITITNNTYSVHHFNGSWLESDKKTKMEFCKRIHQILGFRLGNIIVWWIVKAGALRNKLFG